MGDGTQVNVAVAVEQLSEKKGKHRKGMQERQAAGGDGLSSSSTSSSAVSTSRPRSVHVDVLWMPLRLEEVDVYVRDA